MSGGGPWPRVISGDPSFGPPISELATFPVRSVRRAASRVTVGPAPGTASPIAPLSAYRPGGNGATTRTAAEAAGAATASATRIAARPRVTRGVSRSRARPRSL